MKKILITSVLSLTVLITGTALASHSWSVFHWARTSNPFTLYVGDSVSSKWDSALALASSDWSTSSVLDTQIVSGTANPKTCKPADGRIEVCNSSYGNTGWLGIAQVWITGGEHITKSAVKLNDFYHDYAPYNAPEWRNFVMCQEVGHAFGLDHQDEDFDNLNLGTCMDYTDNPADNQHPNAHDYAELEAIYAHTDLFTTIIEPSTDGGGSGPGGGNGGGKGRGNSVGFEIASEHAEFGQAVRLSADGKPSLYRKNLGNGEEVYTHVFWAR